jgi:5'-methylthioadenosine phosphorylase
MNEAITGVSIGIIGGSGLYQMEGLTVLEERRVETPFGDPSDAYIIGEIAGVRVAFLSRHGRGHRLSPSELNYRAISSASSCSECIRSFRRAPSDR